MQRDLSPPGSERVARVDGAILDALVHLDAVPTTVNPGLRNALQEALQLASRIASRLRYEHGQEEREATRGH